MEQIQSLQERFYWTNPAETKVMHFGRWKDFVTVIEINRSSVYFLCAMRWQRGGTSCQMAGNMTASDKHRVIRRRRRSLGFTAQPVGCILNITASPAASQICSLFCSLEVDPTPLASPSCSPGLRAALSQLTCHTWKCLCGRNRI